MTILFFTSLAGASIFLISIIAIHIIRKDLKFAPNALSKYALGEKGWILTVGLNSIAGAQILLSINLGLLNKFTLGNALLLSAGIATIFISLFKMELPNKTYRGRIHTLAAALQFTMFPAALFYLSDNLTGNWLYEITLLVCSINTALLLIIFIIFLQGKTHTMSYFGLIQKTNIIFMALWVMLVSAIFTFNLF